jgi:hypothetical protein
VITTFWFQDGEVWRLIFLRYLPFVAGLHLLWESAHVRLYTIWYEAEPAYIAFSVLHCTLGDVLIGTAALLAALISTSASSLRHWRWVRIAALTTLIGLAYTVFSEWMNLIWLRSWTYADSMPPLTIGRFKLGLTPVAQWLVVPPTAFYLASRDRCDGTR